MVGIINYGLGTLGSIQNTLEVIGENIDYLQTTYQN